MQSLQIQTGRLHIRHLAMSDLEDFHHYRSNPEVVRYKGFDVMTIEEANAFIHDTSTKQFGKAGNGYNMPLSITKQES